MLTETEMVAAFRRTMPEDDEMTLARMCAAARGESGDQGDFTLDTLILLSPHSPELQPGWPPPDAMEHDEWPHGHYRRDEASMRYVWRAARWCARSNGA